MFDVWGQYVIFDSLVDDNNFVHKLSCIINILQKYRSLHLVFQDFYDDKKLTKHNFVYVKSEANDTQPYICRFPKTAWMMNSETATRRRASKTSLVVL